MPPAPAKPALWKVPQAVEEEPTVSDLRAQPIVVAQ